MQTGAIKKCPHCGSPLPLKATKCGKCHQVVPEELHLLQNADDQDKIVRVGLLISRFHTLLLVIIIAVGVFFLTTLGYQAIFDNPHGLYILVICAVLFVLFLLYRLIVM